MFSSLRSFFLTLTPPAYPTSFLLLPITLWQGTIMAIELAPLADATALVELGLPMSLEMS